MERQDNYSVLTVCSVVTGQVSYFFVPPERATINSDLYQQDSRMDNKKIV